MGHNDDWLMTYADMITLLLCFFAIFLSVSIPKKDALQKVHITHKDDRPIPPGSEAKESIEHSNVNESTSGSEAASPETVDTSYLAPLQIIDRLKSRGPSSIEQQGGDRITTLQMSSAAFFDSGSAALNDSGRAILRDVAVNIESDKYKGYQVTVEGHTDDSPICSLQFPSNWELSTARAAAVVHFLLQQGIPAQKLRAAGYADTFPVAPNRGADGRPIPENQARNRRVVIKLERIDKTH